MFDETLKLILSLSDRKAASALPRRLDTLFERLAHAANAIEASQIEDAIWAAWMSHPDPIAEERLDRIVGAAGNAASDRTVAQDAAR